MPLGDDSSHPLPSLASKSARPTALSPSTLLICIICECAANARGTRADLRRFSFADHAHTRSPSPDFVGSSFGALCTPKLSTTFKRRDRRPRRSANVSFIKKVRLSLRKSNLHSLPCVKGGGTTLRLWRIVGRHSPDGEVGRVRRSRTRGQAFDFIDV